MKLESQNMNRWPQSEANGNNKVFNRGKFCFVVWYFLRKNKDHQNILTISTHFYFYF